MATITTPHDSCATLDPCLFTFKPQLNEKSNQIAQNLLSDFYERQLHQTRRLQEIKDEAGTDHCQWYCRIRPTRLPQSLPNIKANNQSTAADTAGVAESLLETEIKEKLTLPRKGMFTVRVLSVNNP